MLIFDQENLDLKRLINIQKCRSSTKVNHCIPWMRERGAFNNYVDRKIGMGVT